MGPPVHARRSRFGEFELDLRSGELRKHGSKIRLQDQPFQVLALLLEHPGEVVTREELRRKLWPADTFVDFDVGLNTAIKRLRDALGDNAESPRFVETLPRRGYRFVASVTDSTNDLPARPVQDLPTDSSTPVSQQIPAVLQSKPNLVRRRAWQLAAAIVALAASAMLWVGLNPKWRQRLFERAPIVRIHSIAVLPLENLSGDPGQEFFADAMTDALITSLARLRSLRVISRTSAMHYKGTLKSLAEIAGELNLDAVLEGSIVRSGNRVRINAQLIQVEPERHLWAQAYEQDLADIVTLQDDVTRAIANEVRIQLTPQEKTTLVSRRPVNPEAYEAYLKGRYFWHQWTDKGFEKAKQYFQQSIDLDPTYALAHTGLAGYYGVMALTNWLPPQEAWSKAEEILTKALAMDDTLAEAHAMLGQVKLYLHCDRLGAEKEERRALELDSGSDMALDLHSYYLLETGRTDQAIVEKKRVLERDPLSVEVNSELGMYFSRAGLNDAAIQQLKKALELDSNDATTHARLARAYANKQEYEEAVVEIKRALALNKVPGRLGTLGDIYARWGKRTEALAVINELQQMSKQRHVSPTLVAKIYARLGEKDEALRWLERAQPPSHPTISDSGFDSLRTDTRFKEVQRRLTPACITPEM